MENNSDNDSSSSFRSEQQEDQATEEAFNQAVSRVLSGQSIQQVLEGIGLPEHLKEKLRKRLQQALQEKQLRDHEMARQTQEMNTEKSSGISRFWSMSMLASVISKQTLDKIQMIFSQNPSIANQVKEQGRILLRNGVTPDLDFKPGQGVPPPTIGVGLGKGQQQGR